MRDATGSLYRRNRYYDPVTGRFTQEDPVDLVGGLNLYGYAGADPVNFGDPFGNCSLPRQSWKLNFVGRCLVKYRQCGPAEADYFSRNLDHAFVAHIAFAFGDEYSKRMTAEPRGGDGMVNAARHILGTCFMSAYFSERTARQVAFAHEEYSRDNRSVDRKVDEENNERGFRTGREVRADGATRGGGSIAESCYNRTFQMILSGAYSAAAPQ